MQNPPPGDSPSASQSDEATYRAPAVPGGDAAHPALTSGFGAVLERERELQAVTEDMIGEPRENRSAEIDRILRHQHTRLGAIIALLEQRSEALPQPKRFHHWPDQSRPSTHPPRKPRGETELLPALIARHTRLLADIEALIDCTPGGRRSEVILGEVSRSHDEMAWMLTALLKEDETAERMTGDEDGSSLGSVTRGEESWDDDGGPARVNPPTS